MTPRFPRTVLSALAAAALAYTALTGTPLIPTAQASGQTGDHFVDCQASPGGDGSSAAPWNSLPTVNAQQFGPGDRILFNRGSVCDGVLKPTGSGAAGAPIVIDAYGEGAKPQLRGGGVPATVELFNQEHWEIRNLDISNIDADPAQRYLHERRGVVIKLQDHGQGEHYRLSGLDIHDVYGQGKKDLGGSGGIQLEVYAHSDNALRKKTWFHDVIIADNTVTNVNRSGINMSTAWSCRPESGWDGCPVGERADRPWVPSTGLVIRGNQVRNVGGDGIVVQMNRGALVEHNVVSDAANRRNGSNAGIWAWNTDDTLFQYNEAYDIKKLPDNNDGMAFDADYGTTRTVFQYNYSHDNEGGMMLFCGCGGMATKVTFRYNVSDNDAKRMNYAAGANEVAFYNNTVIAPDVSGWKLNDGYQSTTLFANNLFLAKQPVLDDSAAAGGSMLWRNNAFSGPGSWPAGEGNVTLPATMRQPSGEGLERFKISAPKLRGTGIPMAPPGMTDLYGTPVPSTCRPDIGAYQSRTVTDDCGLTNATIRAGERREDVPVAAMQTYRVRAATGTLSVTNPRGITTPAGADGSVVFVATTDATTVSVACAEGTRCTEVTMAPVDNRIIDPSFEANPALRNNVWSGPNTGRGRTQVVSGAKGLTINGVGSGEQRVAGLRPNTDYTLRGYVATPNGRVELGVRDGLGRERAITGTSAALTPVSLSFNSTSDELLTVFCRQSGGTQTAACDDISLTAD